MRDGHPSDPKEHRSITALQKSAIYCRPPATPSITYAELNSSNAGQWVSVNVYPQLLLHRS